MTFEKAKKIFLNRGYVEVSSGTYYDADKWREAITVISKWLKQEPCEDAVRRQAVLNTLDKMDKALDDDRTVESYKELLTECYKDLTPVMPKEKTKWIPVSERLPEESGKYLVTFGGTYLIGIDFYNTEEDTREFFEEPEEYIGWNSDNVIAWMPLPESYKEEGE